MNRKQALRKLDDMFKVGFSYLNVRALLNEIYDSLENKQLTTPVNKLANNRAMERREVKPINKNTINTNIKSSLPPSTAPNQVNSETSKVKPSNQVIHDAMQKLIETDYRIVKLNNFSYNLYHIDHGYLNYYPKADRLHKIKSNTWLDNGFKYINNNLNKFK